MFDLDWFDRWSQGHETCPGCGVDCTEERATRIVTNPDDPALDDAGLARLSWWHTSTSADWPSREYSPAGRLDAATVQRMGGPDHVAKWAARQRAKALHVGTYESAIHNMLRRMRNQPATGAQFYLYRVQLRPDVVASPGCGREVVDWMGDVPLDVVCPAGIDVTRYVNEHEDPGGISLALGRQAISAVQRLAIPRIPTQRPGWWDAAMAQLNHASMLPTPELPEPPSWRERIAMGEHVPAAAAARRDIVGEVTRHLPVNIRDEVAWAARESLADEPYPWCDYLAGSVDLVDRPYEVVDLARAQPVTAVVSGGSPHLGSDGGDGPGAEPS